ncbi:Daunorubicin/doxorubicin resistance ABC transporter permease protein DrrB [Clostridiales bacterium CHKCI001]|nr:Daunorubicin/doxorubicin resistance ABC transporter permease protein DrrB [Clostridiales bacterium CHKCI001]
MEIKLKRYNDTVTMVKRCFMLSKRNPDTLLTSIMLPALMMLLFVSLFGNLVHVGDTSYVNYIVPGVLLQCVGQCSSTTAIMMNKDVTSGIMNRFCTLPIKNLSILNGHILEALVRNLLTSVIVLLVAVLLGFRPSINLMDWGIVLILLAGIILALSWLSIAVGITVNSAEGASALSALAIILPYLSSGFVPTETLPKVMRVFADYQPMTPIIDTMRNALLGNPLEIDVCIIALLWCVGLVVVFYFLSLVLFKNRMNK